MVMFQNISWINWPGHFFPLILPDSHSLSIVKSCDKLFFKKSVIQVTDKTQICNSQVFLHFLLYPDQNQIQVQVLYF